MLSLSALGNARMQICIAKIRAPTARLVCSAKTGPKKTTHKSRGRVRSADLKLNERVRLRGQSLYACLSTLTMNELAYGIYIRDLIVPRGCIS